MIKVILQVRKQMWSMELGPVKGQDTSKSGTTLLGVCPQELDHSAPNWVPSLCIQNKGEWGVSLEQSSIYAIKGKIPRRSL